VHVVDAVERRYPFAQRLFNDVRVQPRRRPLEQDVRGFARHGNAAADHQRRNDGRQDRVDRCPGSPQDHEAGDERGAAAQHVADDVGDRSTDVEVGFAA